MALADPLSLLYAKTIEFVGVGPVGMRRLISSLDYISQGSLRRANLVAPPVQDWLDLFKQWPFKTTVQVSISIRHNSDILLTLKDVFPLHFDIVYSADTSKLPIALISLGSLQVVFARVQSVVFSAWDQYMPLSVRTGIPSKRLGMPRGS